MGLTAAAACHLGGNGERLEQEVAAITADAGCPSPLREIAVCWRQMLAANHGGSISDAVDMLHDLAIGQLRLGLKYFAGVTLHNTANAELARGNYQIAVQLAKDAVEQLEQTDEGAAVVASSQSVAAVAIAESGALSEGLRAALSAATDSYATADAIAEAAYLSAITGRSARAETLLAKFDKGDAPWSKELPSRAQAAYARVALRLCEGDTTGARRALVTAEAIETPPISTGCPERLSSTLPWRIWKVPRMPWSERIRPLPWLRHSAHGAG